MAKQFLYYAGLSSRDGVEQIGVAVSEGGTDWKRAASQPIIPVGSAGDADALQTSNPCVLFDEGRFRMWYQGKGRDGKLSICYAESADGIGWKANAAPLLSSGNALSGYRGGYQQPHVIRDGSTYRMWFAAQDQARSFFSYAESADGIAWEIRNERALEPDIPYEGDLIYYPFVRKTGDAWEMWYTARTKGYNWAICRATSSDGKQWQKDSRNPLLPHVRPSGIIQRIASVFPWLFTNAASIYGSGSPFVREEEGKTILVTHDADASHRLSINEYELQEGRWKKVRSGVLARDTDAWDAYFQADPFILTI